MTVMYLDSKVNISPISNQTRAFNSALTVHITEHWTLDGRLASKVVQNMIDA